MNDNIFDTELKFERKPTGMTVGKVLDWLQWFFRTHEVSHYAGGEMHKQFAQIFVAAMIETLSPLSESDAQLLIASGVKPYAFYRLRYNRHLHGDHTFHIAALENSAFGDGKRVIVTSLGHRLLIEEFNDFAEVRPE